MAAGLIPRTVYAANPAWSQAQAWAYALGAPYHVQHGVPVDALPQPSRQVRGDMALMCKEDWSVETAENLVQTLNWLAHEGHRRPHRLRIRQYCLLDRAAVMARREDLRAAGRAEPEALEELWRLNAVQADWHGVRGGVLLGFDAARAAMLVRAGLVLGWLDEATAWRYLTDMAADVHRSFGSWADYAADYKLSRALWRAVDAPDLFDAITDRLLADERSPWRTLPWTVAGLEVPRPIGPSNEGDPIWSLES